jgi:flagellar biosynthesis/type III secretory pathway M-ring protein FliF/YscJ
MTEPIAWWVWALIWTGLALALLVMLAVLAWWLFRKLMVLFDDASTLAARAQILEVSEAQLPKPAIAVLASARDIREREQARAEHRFERKRLRHERTMARARRITKADPRLLDLPATWYDR